MSSPKKRTYWACLVGQWLSICLATLGTLVQSLVWEDSTSTGELSLCATAAEACVPYSLCSTVREATATRSLTTTTRGSPRAATKTQCNQ